MKNEQNSKNEHNDERVNKVSLYYASKAKTENDSHARKRYSDLAKKILGLHNKEKAADPFWTKAQSNLLTTILFYLYDSRTDEEEFLSDGSPNKFWKGNFSIKTALSLLQKSDEPGNKIKFDEVYLPWRTQDSAYKAEIELEEEYEEFKKLPEETALSIIYSVQAILTELLKRDENGDGLLIEKIVFE